MKFYRCKHFRLYELVSPAIFNKYGQLGWKFLDADILEALDTLRDMFGMLVVNDWKWGGGFINSGLRVNWKGMSAHNRGCAMDSKSKRYSGTEMRHCIRENKPPPHVKSMQAQALWHTNRRKLLSLVNEIELGTTTWLHIAKTNRVKFKWISKPKKGK